MRLILRVVAVGLILCFTASSLLADDLGYDKSRFKAMLKNIASDIEKNFYDPTLKGVDIKAQAEIAKQKIDNAKSDREMMIAIFVFVEKMQNSHTKYMPPARNVKYYYGFDAKAIGDEIRIFEVRKNDVAEKAGLKVGDRLLTMGGFRCERANFDTMWMDFRLLRPRTSLDLLVQTGNDAPREVHLQARLKKEAALLGVDTAEGDFWDYINEIENEANEHPYFTHNYDGGIGYVWVRAFAGDEYGPEFLRGLIDKIATSKAIVVDLRSNAGGAVDTLKSFVGEFVQEETPVISMVGRKKTEPLAAKPVKPNLNVPMYILVDSRSMSCSEIFARHFQRTGKAVVIGDHTPGYVTVAKYFAHTEGAENAVPYGAQIGTARALFPDGADLEGVGVKPDVACVPTRDDMRDGRDVCLNKALAMAREKLGIKQKDDQKVVKDLPAAAIAH